MYAILRKRCLFAGILTFTCAISAAAQTNVKDIMLTGTFISVEPHNCGENQSECEFKLNLLMQFRNNTNEPVIIFRPDAFPGDKKVSFLNGVSRTSTESVSTTIKPASAALPRPPDKRFVIKTQPTPTYDPFESLVRSILSPNSRPVSSVIIPPEGYHEYRASFLIPIGYKLHKEPDQRYKGKFLYSAIPEYPALKIEYSLSLKKRPEHPNPLEKAKENWKEFGNLLLDSGGDYRIESEVILNKLP